MAEKTEDLWKVTGQITSSEGRSLTEFEVDLFSKSLKSEKRLSGASVLSNEKGYYEVTFSPESEPLNVFARVKHGEKSVDSEVRFQAGPSEVINIVVDTSWQNRTALEALNEALLPFLENLELAQLDEEQIKFLAKSSGQDIHRVQWLANAKRASEETGHKADLFFEYQAKREINKGGVSVSFWKRFHEDVEIEISEKFPNDAQAAEIVEFDRPLLKELSSRLEKNEIVSLMELALWSDAQFDALLNSHWSNREPPPPVWATDSAQNPQNIKAISWIRDRLSRVFPRKLIADWTVSGLIRSTTARKRSMGPHGPTAAGSAS